MQVTTQVVKRLRPKPISDEVFTLVFQHLTENYNWLPRRSSSVAAHRAAEAAREAFEKTLAEHGAYFIVESKGVVS